MQLDTLKKISLKRLVGSAKAPKEGTTWLAVVFGVCTSARPGMSDQGEYTKFGGDFIAKGLIAKPKKGEEDVNIAGRAPELQVPNMIEETLLKDGVGADGTFTEVAFRIGITTENGRAKHVLEYIVKPTATSPAEALVAKAGGEYFGAAKEAAPATAKKK